MIYTYNLFCQRKRFSIQEYFIRTTNTNYDDFCKFLIDNNVEPPQRQFFDKEVLIYESRKPKPSIPIEKDQSQQKTVKKSSKRRKKVEVNSEILDDTNDNME